MKPGQLIKVLLLDNYDSFTYNLLRALETAGLSDITVKKNDEIDLDEAGDYDVIVISPGPGAPSEAGICCDLIRRYAAHKPMLGICLGHQAIAEVFGASLYHLPQVRHGVQVPLRILKTDSVFSGLNGEILVGLYHSWAVADPHLPACLEVDAVSDEGVIMAITHRTFPLTGWQFHPESIMTPLGIQMLMNWVTRLVVS